MEKKSAVPFSNLSSVFEACSYIIIYFAIKNYFAIKLFSHFFQLFSHISEGLPSSPGVK